MVKKEVVEAVTNLGLRGDRYMERTGYWSGLDECQVTLIEGEIIHEISRQTGLRIENGEHRRNLLTRGVRLYELRGKSFQIGEAVLTFDRPRPPCGYIQLITQVGMTRALIGDRGGICARVLRSGIIRQGDSIEILP
jgi:MOSC domain-containing protein YiiM